MEQFQEQLVSVLVEIEGQSGLSHIEFMVALLDGLSDEDLAELASNTSASEDLQEAIEIARSRIPTN